MFTRKRPRLGKVSAKLTLPPERYLREDHRLVKKDRGSYVCEAQADGKHGDTFDSGKLADWALSSNAGALEGVEGITVGGQSGRRPRFRPRVLTNRRMG